MRLLQQFALGTAVALGIGSSAFAISLDPTDADTYFVGSITPDGGNPAQEAAEINHLAGLTPDGMNTGLDLFNEDVYDRSDNFLIADLPIAVYSGFKQEDNTNTFTLDGTTTYILGKYDADKAGALVWYVAGLTGPVELPSHFHTQALSHTTFMGGAPSLPDGGTTAALLGVALLGMGGVRRIMRKA